MNLNSDWTLLKLIPPSQGSPHPVSNSEGSPQPQSSHSVSWAPLRWSHSSAPPSAQFCFLPFQGMDPKSAPWQTSCLLPSISEFTSHGAWPAVTLRMNIVTYANRNNCVFPRLHNSGAHCPSLVLCSTLTSTKHFHIPVLLWSLKQSLEEGRASSISSY